MKKLTLDVAELNVDSFDLMARHVDTPDPEWEVLSGLACTQPYLSCRIPCPVT